MSAFKQANKSIAAVLFSIYANLSAADVDENNDKRF